MNLVKCIECGNEYDDDYIASERLRRRTDELICPLCQTLIEEAYLKVMDQEGTGKKEERDGY